MFHFKYAVLSIDGGGIRGIIPCMLLADLERRTGKHIAGLFDLIAGTSTGGILGGALTLKDEKGNPKFQAKDLLGLYTGAEGKEIFPQPEPPFDFIKYARVLYTSMFPGEPIEGILQKKFELDWKKDPEIRSARLKDAYTNLFITSYDTEIKKPFYFRSSQAKLNPEKEDFYMWEVARATSAAPVYFPPKRIDGHFSYTSEHSDEVKTTDHLSLVDGGVFANNPAVLAYVEMLEMWKKTPEYIRQFVNPVKSRGFESTASGDNFASPFLMISVGTGNTLNPYPYDKAKRWPGAKWIMPVLDILMQGVSESVHYEMQTLLPPYIDTAAKKTYQRYYRFNVDIEEDFADLSDVSEKTLAQLVEYGNQLIEQYDEQLDELGELLVRMAEARD